MDVFPWRNWASVKPGSPRTARAHCALGPALHPHHVLRAVFWLASSMRVERRIHVASLSLENYELLGAAPKHKVAVGEYRQGDP